jgi:hypothetical protein
MKPTASRVLIALLLLIIHPLTGLAQAPAEQILADYRRAEQRLATTADSLVFRADVSPQTVSGTV